VPVTLRVNEPVAAEGLAVRLRVELLPAVIEAGLKVPVTPLGNAETDRLIVCPLPEVTAVFTVKDVPAPWATVWFAGTALIEKSFGGGGAVMVRWTVVE
jgi:hypothetical protein